VTLQQLISTAAVTTIVAATVTLKKAFAVVTATIAQCIYAVGII